MANNEFLNQSGADNDFDKITSINDQIKLIKERGLSDYLDRDIDKFSQRFETLKVLRYLPPTNERFQQALELFYEIFDVIPIMYQRLSEIPIFRATTNRVSEVFTSQSRISYNSDATEIKPGKFNVYYQSMFYGCLPYTPLNTDLYLPPRLVASLECCKDLFNPEKTLLVQDITVGRWHVEQAFNAINLCFDQLHLGNNPGLKAANDKFLKYLLEAFSKEAGKFIKTVFEYFSVLCRVGKDENAYYVLSALLTALKAYHKDHNGINVEALISPSAASEGHGLNIVMNPETVDQHLTLNAIVTDRFFLLLPGKKTYCSYPCTEIIVNHQKLKDFQYKFKRYIPIAPRFMNNNSFVELGYGYLLQ